jgi:hypothetical protein
MIEYIVNKDKRTVVAMIKFEDHQECFKNCDDIFDKLADILDIIKKIESWPSSAYKKHASKMFFPRYMSAKAKCSPDDEWNEKYGKELARQRLVDKIHKYRSNCYGIIADTIEEIAERFID